MLCNYETRDPDSAAQRSAAQRFNIMCPGTVLNGTSFMWAWHNQQAGVPPVINGEIANEILADAAAWDVKELMYPIINFPSPAQCEQLLLFITAWAKTACGFYRATVGDAAMVAIPNHKISFQHYLKFYNMEISATDNVVIGALNGKKVEASFDEKSTLVGVS